MRLLEKILNKMRPAFEEKGKLLFFHPLFEVIDNILYSPAKRPQHPPFGRDPLEIKRYMILVIFALFPCFIASVYFFGLHIIFMLLVSYTAGGVVEVLFSLIRKEEINEGFLVSGFIFPLILPPNTPLWIVAVGIVFGIIVGKEVFGGTGRNIFNAALVGRLFIALSYPALLAKSWLAPATGGWGNLFQFAAEQGTDAVSTATPLVLARGGEYTSIFDLFIGSIAGSAGETSALAILLGGVFLIIIGIVNWRTVVAIIVSFAGTNFILNLIDPSLSHSILFNLLSGGLLFGTFFMATDPVTGPVTSSGKWAYGFIIGFLTILIRTFSGFVEGITFAILLGNIFSPIIDQVVIRLKSRGYANER